MADEKVGQVTRSAPGPALAVRLGGRKIFLLRSVDPDVGTHRRSPTGSVWAVDNQRILTARAASSAIISNESSDCNIIRIFAHRVSAGVSVGEKAVLVLKARNK